MQEEKLSRYAELKASIALLEKEAGVLKTEIEERMFAESRELIPTVFGEFKIEGRKTWTYPAAVTRIEEDLKVAKFEAEEKGTASFVEKKFLKFVPTKI